MHDSSAGWYPDPTARFELRYHNGVSWTADVSVDGQRFVDPAGVAMPAAGPSSAGPPIAPAPGGNRVATTSMVLGIVAILVGWMPFVVVAGIVLAALAIGFGIVGRRRARTLGSGGGFAAAGLVTGIVALFVCVGGVVFTVTLIDAVDRFERPPAHDAAILSCTRGDDGRWTARGTITNRSDEAAEFSVRVLFVRPGTDNARRADLVEIDRLDPGASASFESVRGVDLDEVDCLIGAVRGPLPFGVDPGT